jgi:type I restriction enzyme S subunit
MKQEFKQTEIARIPEQWETVSLGDEKVCQIIMGQSPPSTTYNKIQEGLPFLQGNMDFGEIYPSPSIYCSEPIKIAEKNDVLISVRAPVGEVNISPSRVCIGRGLAAIRCRPDRTNDLFLFYYIKYIANKFEAISAGSTFKAIRKNDLNQLEIILPHLQEQKKIAEILSTVDQAIEKVDEAIEKTQRLKKGLMQELLANGIGHKEFKDTGIGKIPKDWEVMKLGEIAELERGKFGFRPRNDPRFYGGKFPFIQTGDITEASGRIKKYSQTLNDEGFKISKLFKKGTIVISIAGNIGDVGILDFDSCFPDSIVGIHPNNERVYHLFLMFLLQNIRNELNSIAPRSTQKNINLEILETFKLPLPPIYEQQKIAEILSTVDKRLEMMRNRKEKLGRVKKGLMEDVLTGKVRVKKLIEEET